MNQLAQLELNLKHLKLATVLKNYRRLAVECLEEKMTYEQFLQALTALEIEARFNNRVKQLIKSARFPKVKTMDEFVFSENTITKEAIIELSTGNFLSDYRNIVLFGPPGAGKTHIALALGRLLCLKGKKVLFETGCSLVQKLVKAKNALTLTNLFAKLNRFDLVIIDELGYIPFEKYEADLLFQFISDRYEKKSLLITTNLAFSQWDQVFQDELVTGATIDRIVHHSVVFQFHVETSFRAEHAKKNLKG